MSAKRVTVVGGTGFLGQYVVRNLANAGYLVTVISRYPTQAEELKVCGDVGQVTLVAGDIRNVAAFTNILEQSWAVVNLVGVLYESGKQNFNNLHAEGAGNLAKAASKAGVERFIQISALGVDEASNSKYANTKHDGEKAVLKHFPDATILRPSVLFGEEDNFFNQFARMACWSPALPLIGGGKTRFQPVYVGDVAEAVCVALEHNNTQGRIYELGGPRVYSFKQILHYICNVTGKKRWYVPLPFWAAKLKATFLQMLPNPLLTRDQVRLLKTDNVVHDSAKNFEHLGIVPRGIDEVVPSYLARFAKH